MTSRSVASSWPGAQQWVPDGAGVDQLASAAQGCRGCDLFADATQAVMGSGPADAEVMVVGEQPGDREDVAGEPFVGPAGRLLDDALAAAGIEPYSVFRTNAVKHFRFDQRGGKRIHKSPSRWQVAKCQPWLLAELDVVRPTTVVLLGATAGQSVFGPSFRVGASRGRPLEWPPDLAGAGPELVVATAHPASVLRSRRRDEEYADLVADLCIAAGRPRG
ncbi:UdgX family uracil-DNA binding protein [Pedococcus sp. 5OH_020]|uniref:UdgX family uracil-DNA binding protein n=1 Tax=Pedococcus sp. 5OH_020 TaxID=2989814 RepID=UPI0022E9E913|nr:UdgX family uracil-DNA binding protein [Pedococcus sp. 5OH_020]